MSPTLDERATVSDPRYTQHVKRSAFLLAVHQAIEIDGMPAPMELHFGVDDHAGLWFDEDQTADVDDWAAHVGATANAELAIHSGPNRPWRTYRAVAAFANHKVELWCVKHIAADEIAAP